MRSLWIPSLLALGAGLSLVAAAEHPWTLQAAVAHAQAAHPEAGLAAARLAAASAQEAQAHAALLPRIDLRATYVQTNQPMQAFGAILNQGTFDDTIDFNSPGQLDAFTAGLHARYALYTGGRTRAHRTAARAATAAAQFDRDAVHAALSLEVVRAYFQVQQATESAHTLAAALASQDEALRVGREREQAGQLLTTERLNLEVQRAQTAAQHLAARHQAELAARRLAFFLGLPPGSVARIAPADPTLATLTAPDADTPDAPPSARPEWHALQHRLAAAEQGVVAARAGRRPTVAAFGSLQADRGWRRAGHGESWTAGVTAELPVFDGAATRAQIRQAEAEADAVRQQLRHLELSLALEREQTRLAHALALEQAAVAAQRVELADASARLSRERFTAGSLLSAELIGVESRATEARLHAIVAQATVHLTAAELRRAAGQPLFND